MNQSNDNNSASESLIKLGRTLADVTKSLKERNDALERHLIESGWTIRQMTPKRNRTHTPTSNSTE